LCRIWDSQTSHRLLELIYLERFSVEHTVQDVVTTMQTLAKKDFNTLAVDCPDAVGSVRADVTKIRQGLFKLLSNGGKFTEQGNITLTVTVTDDDAGEVTTTY
jgi:adenylate cyclase